MSSQIPGPRRLWCVADAFRSGMSVEEVFQVSKIDPWFLAQIEDLVWDEARLTEMACRISIVIHCGD